MVLALPLLTISVYLYYVTPSFDEVENPTGEMKIRYSSVDSTRSSPATNTVNDDKQLVINLLKDAGVTDQEINETFLKIPTWSQITDLYGSKPIVLGTETCQHYRATVSKDNMVLGVAGLFNTGTNAMNSALQNNIRNRVISGQVPW